MALDIVGLTTKLGQIIYSNNAGKWLQCDVNQALVFIDAETMTV